MKNFNEWLSIRSNSYNETEGDGESQSAFDFGNIPGSKNPSGISRAEEKYSNLVDRYGGPEKIRNKKMALAAVIKDIYDFSDPEQLDTVKRDLRILTNRLEMNNNLENLPKGEEESEEGYNGNQEVQ